MLLVTANAMAQSVRERTSEIGVMKTLGFPRAGITALIFGESLLITTLGGAIGLALASMIPGALPPAIKQYVPTIAIPPASYAVGIAMIIGLAAISATLPGVQAARLRIVDALRRNW